MVRKIRRIMCWFGHHIEQIEKPLEKPIQFDSIRKAVLSRVCMCCGKFEFLIVDQFGVGKWIRHQVRKYEDNDLIIWRERY